MYRRKIKLDDPGLVGHDFEISVLAGTIPVQDSSQHIPFKRPRLHGLLDPARPRDRDTGNAGGVEDVLERIGIFVVPALDVRAQAVEFDD